MEKEDIIKEEDKVGPIQRYYYEDMMCRRDKEVEKWHSAWKYTFLALAIMTVLFIASWVGFIYYEQQFEDIVITAEQTADGESNNYAIGGDYLGGTSESHDQKANP